MALTASPFGFRPYRKVGQNYNSGGYSTYTIANAYATNLFSGDAVRLGTGGVVEAWVSLSTNEPNILGVFAGCRYVDPTTQRPIFSRYFPANISSADGTIEAYVYDDPNQTYLVQADNSLVANNLGQAAAISILAAGDTRSGQSRQNLRIATSGSEEIWPSVQIVGFYDRRQGEAFAECEVRLIPHRLAIQTSAG
jgi:hypothetical protein